MSKMFRLLRADEVDCRVAQIKENGLSLLLYKDARCDMNILDETVGEFYWQRRHSRDNANCEVGIFNAQTNEWIWKEDTGTESNTEAEKGLASDSFKRACVNWGIGRELYTAPFIWISADKCKIVGSGGKLKCYDRFEVKSISYNDNREIDGLSIVSNGKEVFSWGKHKSAPQAKTTATKAKPISDMQFVSVTDAIDAMGKTQLAICEHYGIGSISDMNTDQYSDLMKIYNAWRAKQ